jgi:hypothetical protein
MTQATRRRLLFAAIVLALTIPAETILLRAISTPDYAEAVEAWVSGLSAAELDAAADAVQSYPYQYRREIMRKLKPASRADVWRDHLDTYLQERPNLDPAAVPAIRAAIALASPANFANPTAAVREQIRLVAEQLEQMLGRDEAEYLLYRLGPKDGTFASREPMTQKLANWVRSAMVALARDGDCDCNPDFGCQGAGICDQGGSCTPDTEWPACGWMWWEDCTGNCRSVMEG